MHRYCCSGHEDNIEGRTIQSRFNDIIISTRWFNDDVEIPYLMARHSRTLNSVFFIYRIIQRRKLAVIIVVNIEKGSFTCYRCSEYHPIGELWGLLPSPVRMVVRVTAVVQLPVSGFRLTSGESRPTSSDPPGRVTGSTDPRCPALRLFGAWGSPEAPETSPEKRSRNTTLSRFGSGSLTFFFKHFGQTVNTSPGQVFVTCVHKMDAVFGGNRP